MASLGSITARGLGRHVEQLTAHGPRHPEHPEAVRAALAYVAETLDGYGYAVEREEYGEHPHNVNLLARLDGTGDESVLEVGAHWDTVAGSPGADDNASGTAAVLEVARVLVGAAPRRPVRFCVFGDEETSEQFPEGRGGSLAHVARLDAARERTAGQDAAGRDVDGVIVLEMIGYRDTAPGSQQFPEPMLVERPELAVQHRADFVVSVADPSAAGYQEALVTAARSAGPPLPLVPVEVPADHDGHGRRSDHWPYWRSGRRGLFVTDTANFRNPHYHEPTDTLATLDLEFAAQVTRVVAAAVGELAG